MVFDKKDYSFNCGDDTRYINISINSPYIHSMMVQADVAKTVDFSGGTQNVETIVLKECFKLGRIIPPYYTGGIKSLSIYAADELTKLNLSSFENLEHLSIINCESLEEITGLPKKLKSLNLHRVNIEALNLSANTNLEELNIISVASKLNINASQRDFLHDVYVALANDHVNSASSVHLNLMHCSALSTLYVDAGRAPTKIDVRNCFGLTEVILNVGKKSSVTGANNCKHLETFINTNKHAVIKDMLPNQLEQRLQKNAPDNHPDTASLIKTANDKHHEFYEDVLDYGPTMEDKQTIIQQNGARREADQGRGVKIALLSYPEEAIVEVNENDLRKLTKMEPVGKYGFLQAPAQSLFLIEDAAKFPRPEEVFKFARNLKDDPYAIPNFLTNVGKLPNNVLSLTELTPEVTQFLRSYNKKGNYFDYAGKKYKLSRADKVVLFVDQSKLAEKAAQVANSVVAIPLTAIPPAGAIPAPRLNEYQEMLTESQERANQIAQAEIVNADELKSIAAKMFNARARAQSEPLFPESQQPLPRIMPDEQQPIDGGAETFPRPHPDDQTPVDGHAKTRPEPDDQTLIEGRNRRQLPDDQILIDGDANKRPRIQPDDQTLVDAGAEKHPRPEPDDQTLIDAGADKHPRPEPDDQTLINAGADKRPRPDIDDQTLIDAGADKRTRPEPDDQTLIDAGADKRPRPEPDDQTLIDAGADKRPRPEPDDQTLINAGADKRPRPDIDDQTLIDAGTDKRPRPDIDDQTLIDAGADKRPRPDIDDQTLIDAGADKRPRPDIDDQTLIDAGADKRPRPDIDDQMLIDAGADKRPRPDIDDQTLIEAGADKRPRPEIDDQTLIDAGTNKRPRPDIDDQTLINGAANNPTLKNVDPLDVDEPYPQHPINVDKILRATPELKPDLTEDQVFIQANKGVVEPMNIEETHPQTYVDVHKVLRAAPELKPDVTEDQVFIRANKGVVEPMTIEEPLAQTYLDVNKVLREAPELKPDLTEDQIILGKDQQRVENKTPNQPNIYEQVLIDKEANTTTDNQQLLLDSTKALALAMKKMLDAIEPEHIKPQQQTKEFARAASMINFVNLELVKAKHVIAVPQPKTKNVITKDSLLEAADTLIKSIEVLRDAVHQAPQPTPKAELSNQPISDKPINKKE